jgi:hypothetical protein
MENGLHCKLTNGASTWVQNLGGDINDLQKA